MALVYLLRHGEADYQPIREREWPGAAADLAQLSRVGVEQARVAAEELAEVGATTLVASPMTRALQTAAILAGRLGLPLSVQFDLREWPDGRPCTWEPLSQLRERCTAALQNVIREPPGHEVVIAACHQMVIWSLTGDRRTQPGAWRAIDFPNGT